MKFILSGEQLVETNDSHGLIDKVNQFSDWAIGKEVEYILAPIGNVLKELVIMFCDWLTISMPDIGFIITVLTGLAIMITGRAVKPLLYGTGGLTFAIVWLANAYS